MGKPWTHNELAQIAEASDIMALADELGRSPIAIEIRARSEGYTHLKAPTRFKRSVSEDPTANQACVVCGAAFMPRSSRQRTCGQPECKRKVKQQSTQAYKHRAGLRRPRQNAWTVDDVVILRQNRFLSNQEIHELIPHKSVESIKQKRHDIGLPRLAKCESCGQAFQRLNQHNMCLDCVPDQQSYRAAYRSSLNGRWQMYKNNARRRGIPFYLTINDFAELWQHPCEYCGGEIETIGVDRTDSSKGYTRDNVIVACGRCNEMKNDQPLEDWLEHMRAILRNYGDKV